jgi:hypothetical protein
MDAYRNMEPREEVIETRLAALEKVAEKHHVLRFAVAVALAAIVAASTVTVYAVTPSKPAPCNSEVKVFEHGDVHCAHPAQKMTVTERGLMTVVTCECR